MVDLKHSESYPIAQIGLVKRFGVIANDFETYIPS